MKAFLVIPLLAGLTFSAVANATPENPYGDDYVALAINPETGSVSFGTSGTPDGAASIAMVQCNGHGGPCVIAQAMQYGCVAVAWDPVGSHWAGGQGSAPDVAAAVALTNLGSISPDGQVLGHCSK